MMRIQLAKPDNTFLGPARYNQIFTMHGTTMMFLFAVPGDGGHGRLSGAYDAGHAQRGVPAAERLWLLDVSVRRTFPLRDGFHRHRCRTQAGLPIRRFPARSIRRAKASTSGRR